jgi:hypothetical protein
MMSPETVPTSWCDPTARHTPEWTLHWLFRLALCAEFVGHGAFGVMTKQAWVPYFTLFGFPESWAWRLMPVVGSIDITLGLLALVAPTRAGLLYMALWGLFTASLRPLAGESGWEFLERSYNFGLPFLMMRINAFPPTETLPLPLWQPDPPRLAPGHAAARWADTPAPPQHHAPDRGRPVPGAPPDGGHRHGGGGGL